MNENVVRFTVRAYDYTGKLLDDISFIASDEYDVIHGEGEDITEFMVEVLRKHEEGDFDE